MITISSIRYTIVILLLAFPYLPAQSQEEPRKDSTDILLIWEYGFKGYEYLLYNINLDSAEYFLKKAIDLAYTTSDYEIDDRVANNYISLASFYRRIHDNDAALNCYNNAEQILKKHSPNHKAFGRLYHNKGNIYKEKGDYYRTKEYYEYSIDFLINNGYQSDPDFTFVYSNYIKLLLELELYELAEEKMSLIDIPSINDDPFLEHRLHITNGTSYSQLDNYQQALYHFSEAQRIIDEQEDISEYINQMMIFYYAYIDFYILYGRYQQGLKECDNAILYIESLDPSSTKGKITFHSDIIYRSASIHQRLGDLEKALKIVNIGIENLQGFLQSLSFGDNSIAERNEYTTTLPDLYVLKSKILLEQYRQSNLFENLTASYESYKRAIETVNYMKLAMGDENSKLFATSQVLEIYFEAVYVAKLLYEQTGNTEYLNQSFKFAETSKSFALYSEIKEIEAMQFSDLPVDIREKENRIVGEIQAYEEFLYKQQISEDPDNGQIESLKEKLFHLKDDYNDLKQEIEQNNAKYYELKYNPKFVTLEDIQDQLPYRDALIEYVLSDTLLITYVIDRKGINVFSQTVEPEFANECLEYYLILQNQNFSGGVHDSYKKFVELGQKFYKILVEPCLEYTDRKNLTIVPDGAITYIPFESLVMEATDTEYINYMTLPYIIKEYSIGYSHSSTLMFSKRLKSKSPQNKVLAFAPMYNNPVYELDSILMRQVIGDGKYMVPLVGTLKEVQSIDETVPSDVFINERATEANFKKYASDYNVLHLAMHTIMRDDDPLYSLLAFSNVELGDTIEDNKLYAYEIYNLKLNAEMAVLSSCNSGFGKMQKGEGMMSLARGFIYAGCPSIVMTLWQVADKSSSELMTSFYKYLKKGKSKQEAMRLAKIDYLELADDLTSNPYFWSGFVVLGDSSPIYSKSGFAYWMIVITVFIGFMLYMQFRRSRAKQHADQ